MTNRRTFRADPVILDAPVVIDLEGPHTSDPTKTWTESFPTVRALPGGVLDAVAGAVKVDRSGRVTEIHQAQAIPILRVIVDPAEVGRLETLLEDPDRAVDLKTLWLAASWAVQQLADRPSGGSGVSSSTPDPAGTTSEG